MISWAPTPIPLVKHVIMLHLETQMQGYRGSGVGSFACGQSDYRARPIAITIGMVISAIVGLIRLRS